MGRLKAAIVSVLKFIGLMLALNYTIDFAAGFTTRRELCEKALAIRSVSILGFVGALDGCRTRWGDH